MKKSLTLRLDELALDRLKAAAASTGTNVTEVIETLANLNDDFLSTIDAAAGTIDEEAATVHLTRHLRQARDRMALQRTAQG